MKNLHHMANMEATWESSWPGLLTDSQTENDIHRLEKNLRGKLFVGSVWFDGEERGIKFRPADSYRPGTNYHFRRPVCDP